MLIEKKEDLPVVKSQKVLNSWMTFSLVDYLTYCDTLDTYIKSVIEKYKIKVDFIVYFRRTCVNTEVFLSIAKLRRCMLDYHCYRSDWVYVALKEQLNMPNIEYLWTDSNLIKWRI